MCKHESAVGAAYKMEVSLTPRPLHLQIPLLTFQHPLKLDFKLLMIAVPLYFVVQ